MAQSGFPTIDLEILVKAVIKSKKCKKAVSRLCLLRYWRNFLNLQRSTDTFMCDCPFSLPCVFATLVIDADVHGYLGGHGQQVVLQRSLQQSVVFLSRQRHLLLWRLAGLQFVPQLLQSCHLSRHRRLGRCRLHGSH